MKKLYFVCIAALAMVALLSGCGAKNKTANTPLPSNSGAVIESTNTPLPSNSGAAVESTGTPLPSGGSTEVEATGTPLPSDSGTEVEPSASPLPTETPDAPPTESGVTEEMAREGVENYCRSMYDWGIAEKNPDIMYVTMGEESETEYQVVFRSYTGAFVYFYVDKASGETRLVEYVPALGIEEPAGTIDLYDYLEQGGADGPQIKN